MKKANGNQHSNLTKEQTASEFEGDILQDVSSTCQVKLDDSICSTSSFSKHTGYEIEESGKCMSDE